MKKRLLYISLFAFIVSCSSDDGNKKDPRTVFKYNDLAGGLSSLDPAAARTFENILAVNQLYNGLVEMSDSLKVQPSIARSWKISSDGTIYTFNLRGDVFFHDNEQF